MSEKRSIAHDVLGISQYEYHYERFVNHAWLHLTGENYDAEQLQEVHRLARENPDSLTREQQEKRILAGDLHALSDGRRWTNNILTDWYAYQDIIDTYGERATGKGNALLIGAQTPLSSRSFVSLAESVLGCDHSIIVDPETSPQKARHGNFLLASGLELPLRDDSMDFIILTAYYICSGTLRYPMRHWKRV